MKLASASLLFLVVIGGTFNVAWADDEDELTCACAAAATPGFSIDCSNQGAMTTAVNVLAANVCANDCSSNICQTNFWIVQAHHDYCLESELPDAVEDSLHLYEDACEECSILRKFDSSLPDCPPPNCSNGSGDAAFNAMTAANCVSDCSGALCATNFQTLRAVHDLCEEDDITTLTELGFHDLEEACEDENCNPGDESFDAAQLICNEAGDGGDGGDGGGGGDTPADDGGCPPGSFNFVLEGVCICFSGSSTVEMESGELKAISELALGDYVKTSATHDVFEPVYGFAHYAPNAMSDFLAIHTTNDASPLHISVRHMLRVADGTYQPAGTVQVGDVLFQGHRITAIHDSTTKVGVFAPYTPSGTIVVNGLAASCYVVPDMDIGPLTVSGQWLAHTYEFPHRLACHYLGGSEALCHTYNAEGISVWKETPMRLYEQLLESPEWMQAIVLLMALPILSLFAVVEYVVFQQPLLLAVVAQGAVYYYYARRSNTKTCTKKTV